MFPIALVAPFIMDMLGLNTKNLIIIGIIAAVALGVFIFFKHYEGMKEDLINYETSNKALTEQVFRITEDTVDIKEANERLSATVKKTNKAKTRLEQELAALKLGQNAVKQPTETEKVVNKRTVERLRCIEIASGSEIGPTDATNSVCPHLVGGK